MKPVEWSEEAIYSVQSIYDYIFAESPQNADFVVDALFNLGEKLNIFPENQSRKVLTLQNYFGLTLSHSSPGYQ